MLMRGIFGVVAVVCVGILVGLGLYAARPDDTSVALAQVGEIVSDDGNSTTSFLPTYDSPSDLDVTGSLYRWRFRGHFSQECVPTFYWLLVALYAGPGE